MEIGWEMYVEEGPDLNWVRYRWIVFGRRVVDVLEVVTIAGCCSLIVPEGNLRNVDVLRLLVMPGEGVVLGDVGRTMIVFDRQWYTTEMERDYRVRHVQRMSCQSCRSNVGGVCERNYLFFWHMHVVSARQFQVVDLCVAEGDFEVR